mmetsp:Transcript_70/g.207  ORF Transcript_70/g.207 Transcript_70/m.207 type:complete len:228 (+) Transcript_70:95-778(+)
MVTCVSNCAVRHVGEQPERALQLRLLLAQLAQYVRVVSLPLPQPLAILRLAQRTALGEALLNRIEHGEEAALCGRSTRLDHRAALLQRGTTLLLLAPDGLFQAPVTLPRGDIERNLDKLTRRQVRRAQARCTRHEQVTCRGMRVAQRIPRRGYRTRGGDRGERSGILRHRRASCGCVLCVRKCEHVVALRRAAAESARAEVRRRVPGGVRAAVKQRLWDVRDEVRLS